MKKLLIVLTMLGISVIGFAQSKKVDHVITTVLMNSAVSTTFETEVFYSDHTVKTTILSTGSSSYSYSTILDSYVETW